MKRKCPLDSGHRDHRLGSAEYISCEREAERRKLRKEEELRRDATLARLLAAPATADVSDPARYEDDSIAGMKAKESPAEMMSRLANRPSQRTNDPDFQL